MSSSCFINSPKLDRRPPVKSPGHKGHPHRPPEVGGRWEAASRSSPGEGAEGPRPSGSRPPPGLASATLEEPGHRKVPSSVRASFLQRFHPTTPWHSSSCTSLACSFSPIYEMGIRSLHCFPCKVFALGFFFFFAFGLVLFLSNEAMWERSLYIF